MPTRLVIVFTLFAAYSCGGSDTPPPEEETDTSGTEVVAESVPEPEPPAPSSIRVIHAAAGVSTDTLTGSAGDEDSPSAQFADLAFQVPSAYEEVLLGTDPATVSFRIGSAGGGSAETTAELSSGIPTTLVVYSGADGLAILAMPDEERPVTGQARGRFVNAMVGADSLDLCLPGEGRRGPGRPIISGVAYGDFGGIPAFPSRYQPMTLAGVASLQVREGNATPCGGAVVGTVALPPIDINVPHNLTIVAVGRRTGRPRVARQLLVCEDHPGPGSCVPLPMN